MDPFLAAATALLPPLLAAGFFTCRGPVAQRLAALQMAGSLGALETVLLSVALDAPSSIDLALALVILTLPAIVLFSLFSERWL